MFKLVVLFEFQTILEVINTSSTQRPPQFLSYLQMQRSSSHNELYDCALMRHCKCMVFTLYWIQINNLDVIVFWNVSLSDAKLTNSTFVHVSILTPEHSFKLTFYNLLPKANTLKYSTFFPHLQLSYV